MMVWEILTAIGTLSAVCVALFLPMWQSRRRLSVQVATPSGYKRDKTISVVMTNSGRQAHCHRPGATTLPKALRPSDFISLSFPYITEHLGEIKEILVEDSLGKHWRCDAKSINTALSIQKRKKGLFPVSKEFDE